MTNESSTPGAPDKIKTVEKGRSTLSKWIDGALWVAVIAVLFFAVIPRRSGPDLGPALEISALPVVGDEGNGEARDLPGDLKRPLLIEAFASWCGVCRRQSGLMDDMAEAQKEGKLDVVAVSVDRNARQALEAKNSWPIPVDVLHDARGEFSKRYKIEVLPTYILVGTNGQVKRVTTGSAGASDIRAWLSEE